MFDKNVSATLRARFGSRQLPAVGEVCDDIYTVVLCPVCGSKTLDQHDICLTCGWEYDGCDEEHYSACNGATLSEYRREYLENTQE